MNAQDRPDRPVIVVLCAPKVVRWPGLEPLHEFAEVVHVSDRSGLERALPNADILVATDFRTAVLREVWPRARRLKWIHATSAGVDKLLFPELVESEVPVTNARGLFDRPIAEYVLGMILAFAKDLKGTFELQRHRTWRHRETERIDGRTALIVGVGGIGRESARLLRAAGMEVLGVGRTARDADADFGRVHAGEDLLDLLPQADDVLVAAPLTEQTHGLFGTEAFRRMKPTARLINIGRGPIVQTGALLEALEQEQIAGAALDVFEEEPLPADHPLWERPGVIITAHMAGDFLGWREAAASQFLENFHRWRAGRGPFNLVDKRRGYVPTVPG